MPSKIREKVARGILPRKPPAKMWAGHGQGHVCSGCTIVPDQIEYEFDNGQSSLNADGYRVADSLGGTARVILAPIASVCSRSLSPCAPLALPYDPAYRLRMTPGSFDLELSFRPFNEIQIRIGERPC